MYFKLILNKHSCLREQNIQGWVVLGQIFEYLSLYSAIQKPIGHQKSKDQPQIES